mmetsp:Transcript_12073/g.18418  ORF Transcript_12073/g.18418 Transcript_12073/m.18418 type:complete len:109 (+) Transcript_12073:698-1024(+)
MWSVGVMVAQAILTEPYFPKKCSSSSEFLQQSKAFPEYFKQLTRESFKPETYDSELVDVIKHLLVLDENQRWSAATAQNKISEIQGETYFPNTSLSSFSFFLVYRLRT